MISMATTVSFVALSLALAAWAITLRGVVRERRHRREMQCLLRRESAPGSWIFTEMASDEGTRRFWNRPPGTSRPLVAS